MEDINESIQKLFEDALDILARLEDVSDSEHGITAVQRIELLRAVVLILQNC